MKKLTFLFVLALAFALAPLPANAGVFRFVASHSPKPVQKVGSALKTIMIPPVKAGVVFAKEAGKALWKIVY